MKPQKRNKIFSFICSLIPGAAEMYMGFMKMGVSLMAVFALSIMVPCILQSSDAAVFAAILIWFYSFFHARNIVACDDETFAELTDDYIWTEFLDGKEIHVPSRAVQKWGAVILIVFGASMLLENLSGMVMMCIPDELWDWAYPIVDSIFGTIPEIAIAILIIAIGVRLIMGKKEKLDGEGE